MMSRTKGLIYGIISSSTFGLIPLFALPVIQRGIGVDSVMFYRFGISALILGVCLLIRRHDLKINFRELLALSILGLFYAMTALFLTNSYLYIPSGTATTIHFLYPIVVATVMILFFKDKVSTPLIIAILIAILGVYLLSSSSTMERISIKGLALVLVTVVTYALFIVGVNKSCVYSMDGLKLTFYVLLAGAIVFGLNLLVKDVPLDPITDWDTGIYLLLLALIPTLVSDFTLVLSIQYVGSTTTALLGCMEPVTAMAIGALVFKEAVGVEQIIGMVMILLAVSVVLLATSNNDFDIKRISPLKWLRITKQKEND